MYEQAIEAAVNYWAAFLTSTDAPPRDNGDISGDLAALLMGPTKEASKAESVETFKTALRSMLNARLSGDYKHVAFGVDYHPDRELANAAIAAGIDTDLTSPFPWKTVMWVTPEKVSVRQGYGAESRVLWSAETAE